MIVVFYAARVLLSANEASEGKLAEKMRFFREELQNGFEILKFLWYIAIERVYSAASC